MASNLRVALGRRRSLAVIGSAASVTGCPGARDDGQQVLRVWAHQGQEAEHRALVDIARAFNDAQAQQHRRVELSFFPDFQYSEKVAMAAAAADMPDSFEESSLVFRSGQGAPWELSGLNLRNYASAWRRASLARAFLVSLFQVGVIAGAGLCVNGICQRA